MTTWPAAHSLVWADKINIHKQISSSTFQSTTHVWSKLTRAAFSRPVLKYIHSQQLAVLPLPSSLTSPQMSARLRGRGPGLSRSTSLHSSTFNHRFFLRSRSRGGRREEGVYVKSMLGLKNVALASADPTGFSWFLWRTFLLACRYRS